MALAGAAPASAAPGKRDALGRDTPRAERALDRAEDLKEGRGVRTGRELTPALADLARRSGALDRADRRVARSLLARPTDGAGDPQGDGYGAAEEAPHCSVHFCVHYVAGTEDSPPDTEASGDPAVPDYVEALAAELEVSYTRENTDLGWPDAVGDGTWGGDARTDVYLKQLGDEGLFGYAAPDPGQSGRSRYAYLVMDNDYASAEYPYPYLDPLDPLKVTAAHEYNHALQFAIDSFQDSWMFESTATWMEEEVYPGVDDYLLYLGGWAGCTAVPLTQAAGSPCSLKIYGSSVWNHWLSGRYGQDAVLAAWQASATTTPADFAPAAYHEAIAAQGGQSFESEFAQFSAAMAEWRTAAAGLPDDPSLDVERSPAPTVDGSQQNFTLDHTTFKLLDVPVPSAGVQSLRLNVSLPGGTSGAVALVGREGSETAGILTTAFDQLPSGGSASVELSSPADFERITAVLVNADHSQAGYVAPDWAWTKDDQTFGVRLLTADDTTPPDIGAPDTTITSSPPGSTSSSSAAFEFSSTEGGSTFECSLDGGAFAACPSPRAFSGLGSGGHVFSVRAKDPAGNLDASPATHAWTVSAPPPGGGDPPQQPAPPPQPPPAPPEPPTGEPAVKPLALSVSFPRGLRLLRALSRSVVFRPRCSAACSLSVRLLVDRRTAKKLKLRSRTVARGARRLTKAGRARLIARFTREARRRLRGARRVRFSVVVSARPAQGRAVTSKRSLSLRRES